MELSSCAPDLASALNKWQQFLQFERNLSRHTVRAYTHDVAEFLRFLSQHQAAQISLNALGQADLRDFRGWLSKQAVNGAGTATRARALSSVKNLLQWLDRQGTLHNATICTVRSPKKSRKLPRPLYEGQAFSLLFDVAADDWIGIRDKALFTLLYGCGLRIDEALSLNVRQVPHDGYLRVIGKGRRERQVPVLRQVEDALKTYRATCPFPETPDRPLFMGEKGGRLHQGIAQKTLRQLRVTLGLPETATPHALRHSFATHLLANGANLREIQELLGHASLSTTQLYTELETKELMAIYKKAHPRA